MNWWQWISVVWCVAAYFVGAYVLVVWLLRLPGRIARRRQRRMDELMTEGVLYANCVVRWTGGLEHLKERLSATFPRASRISITELRPQVYRVTSVEMNWPGLGMVSHGQA